MDGGANADSMNGGGGDDLYIVDDLGDRVTEFYAAGGIDKVSSTVTFTLGSNLEHLTLTGTARANGTGNSVSNTLLGNGAANRLDGAGGADSMNGGYGDDLYLVNDAGDRVTEFYAAGGTDRVESAVSFTLGSNLEHLALTGGAAAGTGNALANEIAGNGLSNRLSGLGGNDMLDGGAGADKLFGGAGGDSLKGGLGVDGFYFDTAPDAAANVDKILDFSVADDTIFLDKSVFNGLAAPGALAGGAFVNGAAAGDADDRILYDKGAGKIFYDGDGSGAAASVLFAQVTAGTALTHLDFSAYLPPA
jgi:Ca2+-binding RTX toxin-like protein